MPVTYQQPDQKAGAAPQQPRNDLAAQLARRQAAALRLPPLECGCRDADTPGHREGRCRYAVRAAA